MKRGTGKSKRVTKYRMYGLVMYQFANSIHAGIQFQHAATELEVMSRKDKKLKEAYIRYSTFDKTSIILNGGTTNDNPKKLGTLQKHSNTLKNFGLKVAEFREPDLNDTLTAIAFLVPDHIYDPFIVSKNNKDSEIYNYLISLKLL